MPPMWLNVSHSFQCQVSLFGGAMWLLFTLPCVIRHPHLEKREIPTTSESYEIRHDSSISRDDFNGEVRFVIRNLKKFWIFSRNYYFTLYPKSWIFWGFTIPIEVPLQLFYFPQSAPHMLKCDNDLGYFPFTPLGHIFLSPDRHNAYTGWAPLNSSASAVQKISSSTDN